MGLFVFQFSPVCKFEKFDSFRFGTLRSVRVKQAIIFILLTDFTLTASYSTQMQDQDMKGIQYTVIIKTEI